MVMRHCPTDRQAESTTAETGVTRVRLAATATAWRASLGAAGKVMQSVWISRLIIADLS